MSSTTATPARSPGAEAPDDELFRALREADGGQQERVTEILVQRHVGLVRWVAARYAGRGVDPEDLRQVGFVGLMKAINRFDPDRGIEFVAFARPTVQGEIQRHFRDKRRWIQLPRRLQETKALLRGATETLTHQLGRAPTVAELAGHLDVEEDLVLEAMTAEDTFTLTSLDAAFVSDDPAGAGPLDHLGIEDPSFALLVDLQALRPLLAALPPRERTILELRFFRDLTQTQIGEELGISQMHVSRLLAKTLRQLREQMAGTPAG